MTAYNAGEARLAVVPDASGFQRKLAADMRSVRAEFALDVTANTAQARADIQRFRETQQRDTMRLGVDVALGQAQADMAAFRARQRADGLTVKVDVDTDPAERKTRKLAESTRNDFAKLRKEMSDILPGPGALSANLGMAGLSLVPGAVTGLVELAAALQQVAQAGLAVPGILAGVMASVGTLSVGLSGIKDAYEAVTAASDDQTSSARSSTQANNALRNAAVDNARAHKDLADAYRDARHDLEDLNIEANAGKISEQQAINDALKARRDLLKGGFKDQLDYNDAVLRVASADQRVVESHQRNIETTEKLNDENDKGIEGADRVVAAKEAVVRADQALADAETGSTAALSAAADAMAKLSPNARDVVDTLVELRPQFAEFRKSISQPMLDGISAEIKRVVGADLPVLQNGMGKVATAINGNLKALGASLSSDEAKGLLDRILGNTADAQSRMSAVIDPFIKAIGTLAAAGSDALPRLADDLGRVVDRFDAFIETADDDGRLDKWINDGIDGFEHLLSTLGNIGSAFLSITDAAGGGSGLLSTMDSLTEKLAEFLKSDEGQQKLRDFFQEAREDLAQWIPILKDLPGFVHGVMDAAREWTETLLPPLEKITGFLAEHPDLIEAVATAFVAWKTIDGVATLIEKLGTISTLLKVQIPAAAAEGAAGAAAGLNPWVAAVAAAVAGTMGLAAGSQALSDKLFGQSPPFDPEPGEDPAHYGQRLRDAGFLPPLPEPAAKPDTAGLAAALGAPDAPPPADPRKIQGPMPVGPAPGGLFAPGNSPGATVAPLPPGVTANPADLNGLLGGYASGGATPSQRGPIAGGGYLAVVHPDEFMISARGRASVPDSFLHALNQGVVDPKSLPHFDQGGPGNIDAYGNPITAGSLPGPSQPSIAPNPTTSGGLPGIMGSIISGLSGTIGTATSVAGAIPGVAGQFSGGTTPAIPGITEAGSQLGNIASNAAQMPGIAGLIGSLASPDPLASSLNWTSQTANYVANWGVQTLGSLAQTLSQGALGFFGLENSILSPSNVYNQAFQQAGQFALGQDGPLAGFMGMGGTGTGAPQLGQQSIQLGDGSVISIPTFGTAGTPNTAGTAPTSGGGATQGGAMHLAAGQWDAMDALAKSQFKLTMTSGFRDPGGPTIAGVPAAKSYHGSGRAHDYGGSEAEMIAFANYMADNYGSQLKELIFDAPGFSKTIHNGQVVGPFGSFYTLGQAGDHSDHVHIAFAAGGPTPSRRGPFADGGYPAVVHPDEFMISARGRSRVPDSFLHALNTGAVDPATLPQFAEGGSVPAAYTAPSPSYSIPAPPVPRPSMAPGPGAQTKTVPGPTTGSGGPAAVPPPTADTSVPPPASAGQPAEVGPATGPASGGVYSPQISAAPSNLDHNLPALSKGVTSAASAVGQAISTAIGIATSMGAAGAGGAGIPGASSLGALGGLGSYAAGLAQQGGKIVNDVLNVGSSFMVGSLPGSFGTQDRAYGQTVRAPQNAPVTAPTSGGNTWHITGVSDIDRLMQEVDLREAQSRAGLARYGG